MSATTNPPDVPIAGPGIAQPGHNRSGYQDTRDEFVELVANQLKGLDVWDKREKLDDELAPRANDFIKGLKKLKKEGKEARKAEKLPHTEAAAAVDTWWKQQADKIDKALAVITPKVEAFLKEKEAEKQRAAALAAKQKQQALDDADAARAAVAHAGSASQRIEAETRAEQAEKDAATAAKAEKSAAAPARVASATGLAQNTGLRTVWSVDIEDRKRAINYFLLTEPEAFDERIKQLAGEALRSAPVIDGAKQVPEIAGLVFKSDKVFK